MAQITVLYLELLSERSDAMTLEIIVLVTYAVITPISLICVINIVVDFIKSIKKGKTK